LIAGDQVVIEQLRKRAPWIEAVEVKRALSRQAGDVIPPARARELIRTGARRALERAAAGELSVYRGEPPPYEIEVELRGEPEPALRENLAGLPEFSWVGERTVATTADEMDLGFRRIAYLSIAQRPGARRY